AARGDGLAIELGRLGHVRPDRRWYRLAAWLAVQDGGAPGPGGLNLDRTASIGAAWPPGRRGPPGGGSGARFPGRRPAAVADRFRIGEIEIPREIDPRVPPALPNDGMAH